MANLERIYTIPLRDAYETVRNKRGKRAIDIIRAFALRHMKAKDARISEGVNSMVLRDSIQKPPRRIKVRMIKGEENLVRVWLIGEEEKIKAASDKKKKSEEDAKKASEEAKKKAEDAKKAAEDAKKKAAEAKSQVAAPGASAPQAQEKAKPASAPAAAAPSQKSVQAAQVPKAASTPQSSVISQAKK